MDYRDYKKVASIATADGYKRLLNLECGHTVFRYSKTPPKKVKCEHCLIEEKESKENEAKNRV